MASSTSPGAFSASSSLYCAEDAGDVASWEEADEWAPPLSSPTAAPLAGGPGGRPVAALLAAEADHVPSPDYLLRFHARDLDAAARSDAVNWILKVNEFYHFRPVTAYLSVNYLDRYLSSHTLPQLKGGEGGGGWPLQLLSVACVSVAAKMEETHVPLLLDLQIVEPRFVFEPRTVRRMELLLMAALKWRMRAVTPFDFVPHLTAPLLSPAAPAILRRTAQLILSTHREVDFLGFRPSAIAAAAFLCATSESAGDDGDSLSSLYELVSKEVVGGCRQLMEAYLIDTCPSVRQPNRKPAILEAPPPSPVGVLDASACGSCDTQKSLSDYGGGALDLDPPPPKRRRVGGAANRCTGGTEIGGDDGKSPSKD